MIISILLPGKVISKLEFRPTEQHGLAVSAKIFNFIPYALQIMRTEIDRIAENEYARKEGVEQGIEQARHSDVVNLLAFGMSPEDISKALKIPLEKVASIAKKK